jgi:hypothetical protein
LQSNSRSSQQLAQLLMFGLIAGAKDNCLFQQQRIPPGDFFDE